MDSDSRMSWRDVLSRSKSRICCMRRYHRLLAVVDAAGGVLECGKSDS